MLIRRSLYWDGAHSAMSYTITLPDNHHRGYLQFVMKLEQLERLRSEDTPRRPVITLTIDQFILNPKSILLISSYRIPSQKKVKAEKNRKICEKI